MSSRHEMRRLAMQVLYQLDVRGEADREAIRESLADGPDDATTAGEAFDLAWGAWSGRADADAGVAVWAEEWPTHRQPPVDRAILRLAYHEMTSRRVPVTIAINEAIELAKTFGSEQSATFINAVLDKLAKHPPGEAGAPAETPPTGHAYD